MKFLCYLFVFMTAGLRATGLKPGVTAGPMLGYAEHREVLVWVLVRCGKDLQLDYAPENDNKKITSLHFSLSGAKGEEIPLRIRISNLEMGQSYTYSIKVDKKVQSFPYPLKFKTRALWEFRKDPPDFSFAAGSCTYINDSLYDRPGAPYGKGTPVFDHITNSGADFMIWLGDNTYLREADYSSMSGIRHRYAHTRKDSSLQKLFAIMNHYAIWDDHDFGPNDANASYELKDSTLKTFTEFWGNKTYGQSDDPGIYGRFSYSDCEFFLLDNRYHRDANETSDSLRPGRTQLGEKQLRWLMNGLLSSRASFKFICIGGQFLNELNKFESYTRYAKEREQILDFIAQNKIRGVIFISGDRHFSEMEKKTYRGMHFYEVTSSPMTSGATNVKGLPEEKNPQRVEGTLVETQNYCLFSVSGKFRGDRSVSISCFDRNGVKRWEQRISEKELR